MYMQSCDESSINNQFKELNNYFSQCTAHNNYLFYITKIIINKYLKYINYIIIKIYNKYF